MYNKLFEKILDSSIWLQPNPIRIVWITLLAAMDQDGYAHFSAIENLALRARVSIKEAEKAVECFLAPDPDSANPANGGRRIERVPGGFMILNAQYYRDIVTRDISRIRTRERVQKHRDKKRAETEVGVTCNAHVTQSEADAEADAEAGGGGTGKISWAFAQKLLIDWRKNGADYTEDELKHAFNAFEANGWRFGVNPVSDARAALERQIQTDRDKKYDRPTKTNSGPRQQRNAGTPKTGSWGEDAKLQ